MCIEDPDIIREFPPCSRNSSTDAAVLGRPGVATSMTHAGLSENVLRLMEASRPGCLSKQPTTTGQIEGDNLQLRALAQIGARNLEELITQTYIGGHENMKMAVENVAVALLGLQIEMARLIEASRDSQLAERGEPGPFLSVQNLKERLLIVLDPERTANLAVKRIA
jgi:hypothetical protein